MFFLRTNGRIHLDLFAAILQEGGGETKLWWTSIVPAQSYSQTGPSSCSPTEIRSNLQLAPNGLVLGVECPDCQVWWHTDGFVVRICFHGSSVPSGMLLLLDARPCSRCRLPRLPSVWAYWWLCCPNTFPSIVSAFWYASSA